ncbi:molybdate transport system permease protein [Arthrobacter woluwensis]|uniref:Molybdate transport system permease protein n=2 Tax=Arthrobacter woluwensis TaxID=156980 RepID=A0A1H4S8X2_9MICC|nr:molybdate transport system permease protein [Arthrobacter woluwensis]
MSDPGGEATRAPRGRAGVGRNRRDGARLDGGRLNDTRSNSARLNGVPGWMLLAAVLGLAFILVPPLAMALKVDWAHFIPLVTSQASVDALSLSLRTACLSTVLCIVLGVPLAAVLSRARFPGQRVLRALVLLPLVIPPVVGGLALLYAFGRFGLLGPPLRAVGVELSFSTAAVVLAQAFVSLPYLVLSMEGALSSGDVRYETVAATLGSSPAATWWRVTLPLALPGLLSGAVLAFARCLGEFGATLTFAGNLQGVTRTLPLEIYLARESDPDAAAALALLLVAVAVLVVGLAHGPWVRRKAGVR